MDTAAHECKYCGSLRDRDDLYKIDAKHSVREVGFYCGSVLRIEISGREVWRWMQQCSGRLELGLDHCLKMPDSW
jgi:hypothetical protein